MFNNILNLNDISSKKLILPTGNTPLGLYNQIIARSIDLSNSETWNLDEYYPIAKSDTNSYHYYMWSNLFSKTNIKPENVHILNGQVEESNVEQECTNFSKQILSNSIDIAFIGVGVNGHVAFNEPGSEPTSQTRKVTLTESTKTINNVNYDYALSVGVSEIYASKKVILMATGKSKSPVIQQLVNCWLDQKPSDSNCPCVDKAGTSSFDLNQCPITHMISHTNFEVHVDHDAFSLVLSQINDKFSKFNKILVLSPHPDDDVIGMGATIKKFIDNKKDVHVIYQTTGARGGDVKTRQIESVNALKLLGLTDESKIIFGSSPFYDKRDEPGSEDFDYTLDLINRIKPDVLFFAGDTQDPNYTHLKCWKIVANIINKLNIPAYNYYSAWYKPEKYDVVEYFDRNLMDVKINSIKVHQSQINPKFHGNLTNEFYELAEERNDRDFNTSPNYYLEGFNKYNQ